MSWISVTDGGVASSVKTDPEDKATSLVINGSCPARVVSVSK
jgi:hypothetical protein